MTQNAKDHSEVLTSPPDNPSGWSPPCEKESDRKVVLRYWEAAEAGADGKPPIKRVYVELPGYPTFFGQRSSAKLDGRSGTVVWGSASDNLGPSGARALARRAFNPVPDFFWELESMVPGRKSAERSIPKEAADDRGLDPYDDPAPTSPEEMRMLPCAYARADTMALDPARLQHPMPEKVTLLVGASQPERLVEALRKVTNLEVVRSELETGDFVVANRMVFVRKSNDEFHDSLSDKGSHIMKEAEAMSATGLHRVMMIEGGPYARRKFVLNRLASTLSYLQNVHGIHVTPTMNERHTVYALVQAIKHHMFGVFSEVVAADPIDQETPTVDPCRSAMTMLRHVPGISDERAKALTRKFGTISKIATASEAELRQVSGIGAKTAAALHAVFHSSLD
jgi:ERCC4-type nuclease